MSHFLEGNDSHKIPKKKKTPQKRKDKGKKRKKKSNPFSFHFLELWTKYTENPNPLEKLSLKKAYFQYPRCGDVDQ